MTDRRQYRPLSLDLEDEPDYSKNNVPVARQWPFLITVIVCTVGMVAAFALGKHSATLRCGDMSSPIQLRTVSRTFRYNKMFGGKPSPDTNAAWASLFPVQGGFFKHPDLAPERSALAVFHILHCVDGLRHGYYALHDALLADTPLNVNALPFHASPEHAEHCLDLLRQNIICSPDLTVEVVNEEVGGVTGFGTEHQCKDWDQLNDWMAQWEGWHHTPKHQHMDSGDHGEHDGHIFGHDHGSTP